ncbi:MAG: MOSC domain-containing protein [Alphaproteobacteria bacterium]
MGILGRVESLWRYPVKSMKGEQLAEAFFGFGGVHGDRLYAFRSPESPPGFPYLTARENHGLLLHRPRFRHPDRALMPPNLREAAAFDAVLATAPSDPEDLALDVATPDGRVLAIDDRELAGTLGAALSLLRSDKAITDCRPVSLISVQTTRTLGDECGRPVDKRRFRANVYLDLGTAAGFAEDGFVGRTIGLGERVKIHVLERDPRCAMITLDPDTAERDFQVLKTVTSRHDGYAGVYAAVLAEGVVREGDAIAVIG